MQASPFLVILVIIASTLPGRAFNLWVLQLLDHTVSHGNVCRSGGTCNNGQSLTHGLTHVRCFSDPLFQIPFLLVHATTFS